MLTIPGLILVLLFSAGQQTPAIGIVDFYGLRSVKEEQARQAIQIKEGDALPEPWQASRAKAQRRLNALPHVAQAQVQVVCCEAGKLIIYVGVREIGTPALRFRSAPRGQVRLPAEILRVGDAYSEASSKSVMTGNAGEDDSQGHSLAADPEVRAFEEKFIAYAAHDLELLRVVLHESAEATHRAWAAHIIAYAPNKKAIVEDLVFATRDPDGDVRNNALRALGVLAGFAQSASGRGIKVPLQPFVDLVNSVEWTDRNKSAMALFNLTRTRDKSVLAYLRLRAVRSLVDMSRWKNPGHAQYPFFVLGRLADIPEAEIQIAWDEGKREVLIERVLRYSKKPQIPSTQRKT
jgi:hypothetical protein